MLLFFFCCRACEPEKCMGAWQMRQDRRLNHVSRLTAATKLTAKIFSNCQVNGAESVFQLQSQSQSRARSKSRPEASGSFYVRWFIICVCYLAHTYARPCRRSCHIQAPGIAPKARQKHSSWQFICLCDLLAGVWDPRGGKRKARIRNLWLALGACHWQLRLPLQLLQLAFLISIYKWLPFREPFGGFWWLIRGSSADSRQVKLLICHRMLFGEPEAWPNVLM